MNFLKKILSLSAICFFIYLPSSTQAESNYTDNITIYNASGEITAVPGVVSAAVIVIEIPEGSYIYANPKGRGIGKAAELTIGKNGFVKSWEVKYPEGTKYQAKGDPDSVMIYRKVVRIPVVFTLKEFTAPGDYLLKVNLSILMCDNSTCSPIEKDLDIKIRVAAGITKSRPLMMDQLSEFISLKKNINTISEDIKAGKKIISAISDSGIPESIVFTPHYNESNITGLLQAVLFGILAGFILNFMPCVLPVVSLKIMSFVMNAGEKKKIIAVQGFLFSGGIIVSFLGLASLAAFSGYRWGALFQNKFFIIIMASFIFAMALSLLGVFFLNVPLSAQRAASRKHSIYTDALMKGVFATLLATPCSGPFLGGTLAWAFTQSPGIIFALFISVGIGMALPYLLLALNPSWLKILPKPGAWTNIFETSMGFLMLFTVVYLLGILDSSSRMGMILFLLFLAIGLWQYGAFGSYVNKKWERLASFIVLLLIIIIGYSLSFGYFYQEKTFIHERTGFSSEKILKNRDNGIVTVIEFTADWCPNCSLVEKLSLENIEVQKLFAKEKVEFMVADITRKNPAAESLMNRLGSKSIPLLVILPPGEGFSSPLCLRDIYSAENVIENITRAEKFIIKQ